MLEKMDERFITKVNKTATCWLWTGGLDSWNYGNYRLNGKCVKAHRYSYMINKGNIPEGMLIRHTCDEPKCVNPSHLILGTHQDNMNDRNQRNRQARNKGEKSGNAKANNDIVKEIRILYGFGFTHIELANKYNIGRTSVGLIINKKAWSHI